MKMGNAMKPQFIELLLPPTVPPPSPTKTSEGRREIARILHRQIIQAGIHERGIQKGERSESRREITFSVSGRNSGEGSVHAERRALRAKTILLSRITFFLVSGTNLRRKQGLYKGERCPYIRLFFETIINL